ncbi:hypothetical protein PoB_001930300 [Plakobranchus ocellatus]|uniref:Uncharacterized protein n=1 Tax=Plakobranchus ocellatus TaxID=259542 RepID=A0AAV3ZEB8_9GAST|nr:hypothetical protein PoB_001930300 [Plakobranchus ocellatus]
MLGFRDFPIALSSIVQMTSGIPVFLNLVPHLALPLRSALILRHTRQHLDGAGFKNKVLSAMAVYWNPNLDTGIPDP